MWRLRPFRRHKHMRWRDTAQPKQRSVTSRWLTNMSFGQKLVCQPIGRILFEWSKSVHKLLKYWSRKLEPWRAFNALEHWTKRLRCVYVSTPNSTNIPPIAKLISFLDSARFSTYNSWMGLSEKTIWTREWRNLPFAWTPSNVQSCYAAHYAPPIIFALSYKHDLWPKLSYIP